jgi:hypothetical protein
MSTPRFRRSLVALPVLACLGLGFASALLPDDPSWPPGLYDGDDDDAAVTPEPLDGAVALIVDTTGVRLPVQGQALLGLAAASVGPPRPAVAQSPLLRSPPA